MVIGCSLLREKKHKSVLDGELPDVDEQHPVGGGEDGGRDGEAESKGTCIPIFFINFLHFHFASDDGVELDLAAIAFLITSICFFLTIHVTSPKLSKNFFTMMAFSQLMGRFDEDLVVARKGRCPRGRG